MSNGNSIDVAIIGAAGSTGRQLLEILALHPELNLIHVTSNRHVGKSVKDVFPALEGKCGLTFKSHDALLPENIPVFLAVPNETSLNIVPDLFSRGHRIVDLSGAYRLHNQEQFEKYYGLKHNSFDLMRESIYGLPEMFRNEIKNGAIIANPGCYSTAAILPLFFLGEHRKDLIDIIIDAKSGISGAGGRTEETSFSFQSIHENFRAYKIFNHQHQPEIEEYGFYGEKKRAPLVFIPHLLPLYRGIFSTIVLRWNKKAPENLAAIIKDKTKNEKFVRVLPDPEDVELNRVQNTNFIDIGIRSHKEQTIIITAIDNLIKGAAGQAIQNMNLMLGIPEDSGLHSDLQVTGTT